MGIVDLKIESVVNNPDFNRIWAQGYRAACILLEEQAAFLRRIAREEGVTVNIDPDELECAAAFLRRSAKAAGITLP